MTVLEQYPDSSKEDNRSETIGLRRATSILSWDDPCHLLSVQFCLLFFPALYATLTRGSVTKQALRPPPQCYTPPDFLFEKIVQHDLPSSTRTHRPRHTSTHKRPTVHYTTSRSTYIWHMCDAKEGQNRETLFWASEWNFFPNKDGVCSGGRTKRPGPLGQLGCLHCTARRCMLITVRGGTESSEPL